jgi:putative CocE/NonD family hydrolase
MSGMNPFSMGKCGNFNVYHITWLYTQTINNIRASDRPFPEKMALIRKLEENMAKIPAQVGLLPQRELPAAYVDGYPLFLDYVEFLDRLDDPEFRKRIHCPIDFGNMDVAMFHSAGWFDETHEGILDNYEAATKLGKTNKMKNGQKLVIGPWVHGGSMSDNLDGVSFGELGGGYAYGMTELIYRWFDYWLKGIDNGIMDEPKVDLFVMGANRWRKEAEWPIARTVYTDFYLSEGGKLSSSPGADGTDAYVYNPLDPAPSEGSDQSGARVIRDRSSLCARDDVLVYRTEPMTAETEITGRLKLKLFASTNVPDTDFICNFSIVTPEDKIYGLSHGIMRARYRHSVTKAEFLNPDEIYDFTIDMGSTSYLFPVGSRMQLDITSSSFPSVDLNLNTTDHPGAGRIPAIAHTKVHFGGIKASKLILPVLPN